MSSGTSSTTAPDILVLEDSRFDVELLTEALIAALPEARVTVVCDEEGFTGALESARYQLILSDYELPGFSGAHALEIARAVAPLTPFIFVSGVIGEDNAVELLKRGATDYVSKGRLARLPVVMERALKEAADREAKQAAEAKLRVAHEIFGAAEARRLALIELSDRIRDMDGICEIAYTASQMLGTQLGVDRAGYGLVNTAAETIEIERDWTAPGVSSLAGTLRFRDYGSYIDDLRRGTTVVFADAHEDPRTRANAAALDGIGARAVVNMPLTERGGLVGLLLSQPRQRAPLVARRARFHRRGRRAHPLGDRAARGAARAAGLRRIAGARGRGAHARARPHLGTEPGPAGRGQ
ncbi:response regulator [Variovorax sp. UC122_21]|uniref:response regulator n=1 Tax=Variovorax sp. UC122_21 TaxID=3374554 RepID=UPI0037569681